MRKRSSFGWVEFLSGLSMILLGVFTLVKPLGVFTWVAVIYGIIAIITGICDILFFIRTENYTGFGPVISLISGILSVMVGTILIAHPGVGRWILSILFPLWFIAHCISRLTHLSTIKIIGGNAYYYFSLVLNILGLVCGIIMLFDPVYTVVALGLLIGIYLILSGIESVVIAFSDVGAKL